MVPNLLHLKYILNKERDIFFFRETLAKQMLPFSITLYSGFLCSISNWSPLPQIPLGRLFISKPYCKITGSVENGFQIFETKRSNSISRCMNSVQQTTLPLLNSVLPAVPRLMIRSGWCFLNGFQ